MNAELLVVAGEASGDRAAASVIAKLPGVHAFGMGGGALAREGVELIRDLRDTTALGLGEVARRAVSVTAAFARIRVAAHERKPAAALLVNYTEFNTRLAEALWRTGTRILWYGAPQIWAWRGGRGTSLRRHVDRMACMFPFEEALWRARGVDAHYVGHPAVEDRRGDRVSARELLGLTPFAWAVALVPGSRPHEVRRLLGPMLVAYETVRRDRASVDGRILLAPSLDVGTRAWARSLAAAHRVEVVDVDARAGMAFALPAFDAALCASGTAALECALAGVPPIVCYRVGLATELGARAWMTTPFVALPNILLQRLAFPELLQREATAPKIAEALDLVLEDRTGYGIACDAVRQTLADRRSPSQDVARMLVPWLKVPGRTVAA